MLKKPKKKLRSYSKKCKTISIYLTKDDKLLFETAAKIMGLTVSQFLHSVAFDIIKDIKKKNNKIIDKSPAINLLSVDEVFKNFLTEDEINEVDKEVDEIYKV